MLGVEVFGVRKGNHAAGEKYNIPSNATPSEGSPTFPQERGMVKSARLRTDFCNIPIMRWQIVTRCITLSPLKLRVRY